MNAETAWTQINVTMSDKSARNEFGLTQEDITQAMQLGKLQYRSNNMHGNPYFKLIRSEVKALVAEKYGEQYVKTKLFEKELKEINRALNLAKRSITKLSKRKAELVNLLKTT